MDLGQIRAEIDEIDRQIITLVAKRNEYVREVVKHKHSDGEVRVPNREAEVLDNVHRVATELGADVDVVERIYRTLLAAFVDFELRHRNSSDTSSPV